MSKGTAIPRPEAQKLAEEVITKLKQAGSTKVEIAGSLRRKESFIGDLDIIIDGKLTNLTSIKDLNIQAGTEFVTAKFKGIQINILHSNPVEWGAALFYLTGPTRYAIAYRMKAKVKGWRLNQHGLFDEEGNRIAGETEESIYKAFDKNWKAPEKRGR